MDNIEYKMDNKNSANSAIKYNCGCCEYNTSRKNDYDRHLSSVKHKKTEMDKNIAELIQIISSILICF